MGRYDERDTIFARMERKPGTWQYDDYYKRNPDKKYGDDYLRSLPGLLSEGTSEYHLVNSLIAETVFGVIGDITTADVGKKDTGGIKVDKVYITEKIKAISKYFGAVLVGITDLRDEDLYSHRGRKDENYGEEINLRHTHAIVFAVEMAEDMIAHAPGLDEVIAVSKGYLDAAIIGQVIAGFISQLGYGARNHMDGSYLVIAPKIARRAGLGEIGRLGLLVTEKYGPRVRLGVVTTDLELVSDKKVDFGLKAFCESCGICADNCPAGAILSGSVIHESCYEMWRNFGTDCGVCLSSCPYSYGDFDGDLAGHIKRHGRRRYLKEPSDMTL